MSAPTSSAETPGPNCNFCTRSSAECGVLNKAPNRDVYICLACAEKAIHEIKNPPAPPQPESTNATIVVLALLILALGVLAMSSL